METYNKVTGLEFLSRALGKSRVATVLPWRVYHKPEEFDPSHFPRNTKRFLLRTNLDGSLHPEVWRQLPRDEANLEPQTTGPSNTVFNRMHKLHADWRNAFGLHSNYLEPHQRQIGAFHYIVHAVKPRKDYVAHIRIVHDCGQEDRIFLTYTPQYSHTWRSGVMDQLIHYNDRNVAHVLKYLTSVSDGLGLTPQKAALVLKNIKTARTQLVRRLKQEGMNPDQVFFEASAAVTRANPTKIEFYDLLFK